MRFGITYDLKDAAAQLPGQPDDLQEEFDSPKTIDAIAAVLRSRGHDVVKLGDGRGLLQQLLADPPDFVFNLAEGAGIGRSREARVPALCEMLGIPHTGSDPLTLAVTLDKPIAKTIVAAAGVSVPASALVEPDGPLPHAINLRFPVILKPAWEGSSKGIRDRSLVEEPAELAPLLHAMRQDYRQPIMIEEFISGAEVTVGVIGNNPPQVIGCLHVVPKENPDKFVYGLEVKRNYHHRVEYVSPPRLPGPTIEVIEKAALRCYHALGCRDVARVDFRVRDGMPYFLEVNPLPGVNPEDSDLVILAKLRGWSYEQLVGRIVDEANKRYGGTCDR